MASPSSLAHLVIKNHVWLHIWILNYIFIPLILGTESRGDSRHAILYLSEIVYNKWLNNLVTVETTYLLPPATTRYEMTK
jgi:hypothetical protein